MRVLSSATGFAQRLDSDELDQLLTTVKAVIYARVSTQDQAKHGYSLESQVERSAAMARSKFGLVDEELIAIVEHGEMGDDPTRPALNHALWLIEHGVGTRLIVLHPDRLARDLKLQLYITERIWNAGCEISFVEMDVDPKNPESVLLYNIQGAIAQYNKAKILANSKRGRRTKLRQGQIPGNRRVYGYSFDKEHDILIENPSEKAVYLSIVNWFLCGKDGRQMNLTAIAKELSLLSVPAPCGDKWYQATVSRILKNPVYTGKFFYGKTEHLQKAGKKIVVHKPESEWHLIPVPAYIDDETFERIQKRLQSAARRHRGAHPQGAYLVKGLVRCGRCGAAVVAGAPSRHKETGEIVYRYYVCSAKARKVFEVGSGRQVHACAGRNWRQDVVDDYVWRYLRDCVIKSEPVLQAIFNRKDSDKHIEQRLQRRVDLETALHSKHAERERWLHLCVKGRISEQELESAVTVLEEEITQLSHALQILSNTSGSTSLDTLQTATDGRNLEIFKDYILHRVTDMEKQTFANLMLKQVVLHDGIIDIYTTWRGGDSKVSIHRESDGGL